jgi:hypothetical protein
VNRVAANQGGDSETPLSRTSVIAKIKTPYL